jgi:hypothetical protein
MMVIVLAQVVDFFATLLVNKRETTSEREKDGFIYTYVMYRFTNKPETRMEGYTYMSS